MCNLLSNLIFFFLLQPSCFFFYLIIVLTSYKAFLCRGVCESQFQRCLLKLLKSSLLVKFPLSKFIRFCGDTAAQSIKPINRTPLSTFSSGEPFFFERPTFFRSKRCGLIDALIGPGARGTTVRDGGIYAGSVTVDLTDPVIEAGAIFGTAHGVELKTGQESAGQ